MFGGSSANGGTATTGGTRATSSVTANGGTSAVGGARTTSSATATGGTSAVGGARTTSSATATGGTTVANSTTASAPPAVTKIGELQITADGYAASMYGGYLNGESFQEEGILTFNGYQYVSFWNTAKHVVVARRQLPNGSWSAVELTDYTTSSTDDHNTISMGISAVDGTLHLSFDHHGVPLHYRKSIQDLVSNPIAATWIASSFGATTSALVGTTAVDLVTYPRFISEPGGKKMLFGARLGESGAGDEHLWEYDGVTRSWTYLGKYLDGITDSVNAYPHGLSYTKGGTRLHITWCWRATPNASTNQDLMYLYSDDNGRTWKDNRGTTISVTGTTSVRITTTSAKVWTIPQNRGLINQEHMAVDASGRVHVLLGHMPDAQADDATFTSARTKSQYFHYMRSTDGTWVRHSMANAPVVLNFRGKLAISSTSNVYAILPNLRIAAASPNDNFAAWSILATDISRSYYSDPLIDSSRLESSDNLTIYYPVQAVSSKSTIFALDYALK